MTYEEFVDQTPPVKEAIDRVLDTADGDVLDTLLRVVFQAGRAAATAEAADRAVNQMGGWLP